MPLIPNDPFRYFEEIQREMKRIFASDPHLLSRQSTGAFSIRFDETEDELIAICRVPGLKSKEEMEIDVTGQLLTVARNMSSSLEMRGQELYKSEQFWGHYRQTIPLPCPVKGWSTIYSNEELKIQMPKTKR
jgi:HSP20 family protein